VHLGSTASLTDVCWIPGSNRVASTSTDGRLRISHLPIAAIGDSQESTAPSQISASTVQTTSVPMPLSSVRADISGKRLITAGWDGCVAVWGAEEGREEQREQERTKKRRKAVNGIVEEDGVAPASTASMSSISHMWHTTPTNVLDKTPATNSRVSGAVWGADAETCYSAGWDGAVRLWDITTGAANATKTSDKVILCLDAMVGLSDVVVTGHMDRSAALWDLRTSTTNISLSFQGAHAGPICAIRRHPTSSHLFSTGSHDGQVKLWDTRSNHVALFSLVRPSKSKVLTLDWDNSGQTLVSGGEDCRLSVHAGQGIGREDTAA
jgi:ribosome biogenesis protein YTM1